MYTVDQIRRAERPLLDAQSTPDELMQSAASAVAAAARMMLQRPPALPSQERILLAVGAGGNGGDALYAGRDLLDDNWQVEAVLLGREQATGEPRVHQPALEAFIDAGGVVVSPESLWDCQPPRHRLLIDGLLGIGGSGGVDAKDAVVLGYPTSRLFPLLSIDIPSGIDADTGAVPAPVEVVNPVTGWLEMIPAHGIADVTVTFGGLRGAHGISAYCGQVVVADPGIAKRGTIAGELAKLLLIDAIEGDSAASAARDARKNVRAMIATRPIPDSRRRSGRLDQAGPYDLSGADLAPIMLGYSTDGALYGAREPGPYDDKYSGGVVGICAGSDRYPGAAVLATLGAVRTTSSMVRYVGSSTPAVLNACPEVVWAPTIAECGRVQAWVIGPGRGTNDDAAAELAEVLQRPEPVLVDADGLTLLATHAELRAALVARSSMTSENSRDSDPSEPETRAAETLLTPHLGEFRRLAEAITDNQIPDPADDPLGASLALAEALQCSVLLKGRHTIVATPWGVNCIDAGTSWGATPGSGDVLAGLLGALMAQARAQQGIATEVASSGVVLHALAAAIAAETPEGYAPTSASRIAEAIPQAWARSGPSHSERWYEGPSSRT